MESGLKRWIFFDLGNTLIDERNAHGKRNAHLVKLLNEVGCSFSVPDFDHAMTQASEEYAPRLITRALEILVGPDVDHQKLLSQARYDKKLEKPYPGAKEVLVRLTERFKLGVIANQSAGTEDRLRSYGMRSSISVCVSSTETGLAKPDPAIFEMALTHAQCVPENAVMVGDRIDYDIAPARQSGWKTVRIRQGYAKTQQPRSQQEIADYTLDSICDVYKCLFRNMR